MPERPEGADPIGPVDPVDWEQWYVEEFTPWDQGAPIPLLVDALDAGLLGEPGTAFVPGGGRGHDASALAEAGWRTTVVDISPTAASAAKTRYPSLDYVIGDALDPATVLGRIGMVDLMWDHTFFCAFPVEMRPRVAALAAAVVKPGGLLASGVFPIDKPREEPGPPWAYQPDDLGDLLTGFELVHLGEPVKQASQFGYRHQLAVWRRTA